MTAEQAAELLAAGEIGRAVRLFDGLWAAAGPAGRARLWQRGLAGYLAGRFVEAAAQFEQDLAVNGQDAEELIWRLLSRVEADVADGARRPVAAAAAAAELPVAVADPRPVMHALLALYRSGPADGGDAAAERVEAVLRAGDAAAELPAGPMPDGFTARQAREDAPAYARYYCGLWMLGCCDRALWPRGMELVACAAERPSLDFMGQIMTMHARRLQHQLRPGPIRRADGLGYENCPVVVRGGWQLSTGHHGGFDSERAVADLDSAAGAGYHCVDCGDIYSGVEELIGVHAARGKQPALRVHTKLVPDRRVLGDLTPEHVAAVVLRSLNRLRQQQLDLVQFHWWEYGAGSYVQAALALTRLKQEGLVRRIGLTNFSTRRMAEMVDAGVPVAISQVQYSLLDRRPESDGMVQLCLDCGARLACYGVLAGGFLTDRWLGVDSPDLAAAQENRSLTKYALIIQEFGGWGRFQHLLQVLRQVANRHSATIAMVASAWVLSRPAVGCLIVGARDSRHLDSTHAAAQLQLSGQDLRQIQAVLCQCPGPLGEVYGLERTPAHGGVMRYNLNHIGTRLHLLELARRCVRLQLEARGRGSDIPWVDSELEAIGLLASEYQAAAPCRLAADSGSEHMRQRLVDELGCIGDPQVLCCSEAGELEPSERLEAHSLLLMALVRLHLDLKAPTVDELALVRGLKRPAQTMLGGIDEVQLAAGQALCVSCTNALERVLAGGSLHPYLQDAQDMFDVSSGPDAVACRVVLALVAWQLVCTKASSRVELYVHPSAARVWPLLAGLVAEQVQSQGLDWTVTCPPAMPPSNLTAALIPGKNIEAEWIRQHKPGMIVIPHAGIPTSVKSAVEESAGVPGGVYNVHHNCRATGETALMLLLALNRRLMTANRTCRSGDWSFKKRSQSPESGCRLVYCQTAVVVGLGSVGWHVARTLQAMGVTVLATRRSVVEPECDQGVTVHPAGMLRDLLHQADAVILTAPLTEETRGLLDAAMLQACPDGCNIVNVARAELVDEEALWQHVSSGRLGYAADVKKPLINAHLTVGQVWWQEPGVMGIADDASTQNFRSSKFDFHTLENCLMTPHYGGGIGLPGIEEERAAAVVKTLAAAMSGAKKPCDLGLGY